MIALLTIAQGTPGLPNSERAAISLSSFDWATVMVLGLLAWFFFMRDYRSRDELAKTVKALADAVSDLRALMAEQYVSKDDHRREIDRLSDDIDTWTERFRRDLESHKDECPIRGSKA